MLLELNGLSLTSAAIITSEPVIDDCPQPENNVQTIYRRDRSKLVSRQFTRKQITIPGKIIAGSTAELLNTIDSLKAAANYPDAILDITYDSGEVRRYIVNLVSLPFPRKAYSITNIDFNLTLEAADPIAVTPTFTDVNFSIVAATSKVQAINFAGSFSPEPIITITFAGASSSVVLANDYLGQSITLGSVTTSDVIVIDIGKKSVTKNSVAIDYTGVFPKFNFGTNTITITLGTSDSATVNVHYQPRWL